MPSKKNKNKSKQSTDVESSENHKVSPQKTIERNSYCSISKSSSPTVKNMPPNVNNVSVAKLKTPLVAAEVSSSKETVKINKVSNQLTNQKLDSVSTTLDEKEKHMEKIIASKDNRVDLHLDVDSGFSSLNSLLNTPSTPNEEKVNKLKSSPVKIEKNISAKPESPKTKLEAVEKPSSQAANCSEKSDSTQKQQKQGVVERDNTGLGHSEDITKSKAQLRAERRALQESQRAAKAAAKQGGAPSAQQDKIQSQPPKQVQQQRPAPQAQKESSNQASQQQPAKQPSTPSKQKPTGTAGEKNQEDGEGRPRRTSTSQAQASKLRIPDNMMVDDEKVVKRMTKRLEKHNVPSMISRSHSRKVPMFGHLQQYEKGVDLTGGMSFSTEVDGIHPCVLTLGLQFSSEHISGSGARGCALIKTFSQILSDYQTPPNTEFARDFMNHLKPIISFLTQCRPLSIGMGNIIKHFKYHINCIKPHFTEKDAKDYLQNILSSFMANDIELAGKKISKDFIETIEDGDVIMTLGHSDLLLRALQSACEKGKRLKVIVIDGRPKMRGLKMLNDLVRLGISCSYGLSHQISYYLKEANKVVIGVQGVFLNGSVMSTIGSSLLMMNAAKSNIPVIVLCESYKFSDRTQNDSIIFNELGDPNVVVDLGPQRQSPLAGWKSAQNTYVLNLTYDVTPPEFVNILVSEVGFLSPLSISAILRTKWQTTSG